MEKVKCCLVDFFLERGELYPPTPPKVITAKMGRGGKIISIPVDFLFFMKPVLLRNKIRILQFM